MKHADNTFAIILAAGKGTRMQSELPKVLHKVNGKELLTYVLEATVTAGINELFVVVGYQHQQVKETVDKWSSLLPNSSEIKIHFIIQEQQLGTGHAVLMCKEELQNRNGYAIILLGDVPMIKAETIKKTLDYANSNDTDCLVISIHLNEPTGYGRIKRNSSGLVSAIREEKDASVEEKSIQEVNTGTFIFNNSQLWPALNEIQSNNSQQEYYLTDVLEILAEKKQKVDAYLSTDDFEFQGINSLDQLTKLEAQLQ